MDSFGFTAGVGLALVYIGIFGLVFGITRILRNRRWSRDARSNLALSLARCDGNTHGRTSADSSDRRGTVPTVDRGTVAGSDVGNYFRKYRDAGVNGGARPRTVHRDNFGPGVVRGAALGSPHSADAPAVIGEP